MKINEISKSFENGEITKAEYIKIIGELRERANKKRFKPFRPKKAIKVREYITEPVDDGYLEFLLKDINFDVNNCYVEGLQNLLRDKNYNYNSIGLKIVIAKYLKTIELEDLNVFRIDNNRLGKRYRFLAYKHAPKNYSKLYLKDGDIVFNSALADDIQNIVLTVKSDINHFYGGEMNITKNNNDIGNIHQFQYRHKDKEESIFNQLKFLFVQTYNNVIKRDYGGTKYFYELRIDYQGCKVKKDRALKFINENIAYCSDIELLEKIEDFYAELGTENNTMDDEKTFISDYELYKINLRDYFLHP